MFCFPLSYDEFRHEWEEYQKSIKRNVLPCFLDVPVRFEPYGKQHDYHNIYLYGNEVKYIYFKSGVPFPQKKEKKYNPTNSTAYLNNEDVRFSSSLSRTRSRIFELSSCNEFSYFCTFTLDKNLRNRNDLPAFSKAFGQFIRDLNKKRDNKITYLVIPEEHVKGGWHLHGLLNGLTDNDLTPFSTSDYLPKKLLNRIEKGEKIYNFPKYVQKFGYFTATKIKDKNAVSRYITKYITKDLKKNCIDAGQHLYYASKGLKGRECLVKNSFEPLQFDEWDFENDFVKIKTVKI